VANWLLYNVYADLQVKVLVWTFSHILVYFTLWCIKLLLLHICFMFSQCLYFIYVVFMLILLIHFTLILYYYRQQS